MAKPSNLIRLAYQELSVGFTREGWFNATGVASHFGKQPHEWLRLPDTERYLRALEGRYGKIPYVKTSRARVDRGGGTWLHPKLAVAFARWLDIDFSVWCDEQIDALLRGSHPAYDWEKARSTATASFRVMVEVLILARQAEGKTTAQHHFVNEARLIAWAVSGKFEALDRASLTVSQLSLLALLEERNAVLLARSVPYGDRKLLLEQYALDWRAQHRPALEAAA
ncbi:KilA-N domain-containing protein [Methylococcus sp. EFPC2]|uniref:KilA-N domain-containing protein n=1 Tax=Methylococcus sp. EFPC2 TaxID=2812648 RepID=UPI0019683FE5|nr:KilA-N domain-containing protein [Methylococcus sp. EFPC2]QSA98722.1 KilA-N domain-containing protein [Methylococcus sp. EFPC2]